MSVILLANLRAARAARNLAESMSSDPGVRARARVRAMAALMRRERQLQNPQPAEVVILPTRLYLDLRGEPAAPARLTPKDY